MKLTAAGYTLIECLVTVLLLIIVLALSAPVYQHLIARNKTSVYLNQLISAVYYARSEALARHLPVTLCKSINGQQCGGQWRDGWLIFVDPLNTGQVENPEQLLRVYQALPEGDQLTWRSSLAKNDYLQFNRLGHLRQDGSFIYCPHHTGAYSSTYAGKVVISLTGRLRIEKDKSDENNICG